MVGEALVVLSVDAGVFHEFNDVAGRIWEMLGDGPLTTEEICTRLVEEYDVDPQRCLAAVRKFLADAEEDDLVSRIA